MERFEYYKIKSGFKIETLPNTACTRLVGVGAFSSSLRGLELIPSKWRYLVPPISGQREPLGRPIAKKDYSKMKCAVIITNDLKQILYGLCVCQFAVYSRCASISLVKEDVLILRRCSRRLSIGR